MFQYHCTSVILCSVGEINISGRECCISALEHVRILKLSSYVLLACINAFYKYGPLVRFSHMYINFHFWAQELYI